MRSRTAQRGAGSLIFVLILLTVMLVATTSLFKSSEVSTAIAGNTAFKQAATQAGQLGVAAAAVALKGVAAPDVGADRYYPTRLAEDAYGLPSGINWKGVPSSAQGMFSVQYVIDRLCSVSPVTDVASQCQGDTSSETSSAKVGAATYVSIGAVYYRATIRVTGPKNTETFIQALFAI